MYHPMAHAESWRLRDSRAARRAESPIPAVGNLKVP